MNWKPQKIYRLFIYTKFRRLSKWWSDKLNFDSHLNSYMNNALVLRVSKYAINIIKRINHHRNDIAFFLFDRTHKHIQICRNKLVFGLISKTTGQNKKFSNSKSSMANLDRISIDVNLFCWFQKNRLQWCEQHIAVSLFVCRLFVFTSSSFLNDIFGSLYFFFIHCCLHFYPLFLFTYHLK